MNTKHPSQSSRGDQDTFRNPKSFVVRDDVPDAYSTDSEYLKRLLYSVGLSIFLNIFLLWITLGSSLSQFVSFQPKSTPRNQPVEVVLLRKKPSPPKKQEPTPSKTRTFLETDANQVAPEKPRDSDFYSEHNTQATQTEVSPVKSAEIPKADGHNTKTMNTETVLTAQKSSPPPTPPSQPQNQPPTPAVQPQPSPSTPKPTITLPDKGDLALLKNTPLDKKQPRFQENLEPLPSQPITPTSPRAPPTPLPPRNETREVLAAKSKLEGGVQKVGRALAFNSEESPFASYDKKVISKIGTYWRYQVTDKFYGEKVGEVEISFRLLSNGDITDLEVTRNTANSVLAGWCIRAIQQSSPFEPFPTSMKVLVGDSREGTITFSY